MKTSYTGIIIALILILPTTSYTDGSILKFEKKIGIGWDTGVNGWMSFVAFDRNGTMVASDGPEAPHDSNSVLTLWSFPDGKLIKRIPYRPWAISPDFRYYASHHAMFDIESGKALFLLTLNENDWALPKFSNDGLHIAFSILYGKKGSDAKQIRILRTLDGKLVNEFGKRKVFSLAFHPGNKIIASGHWDNVTLWNILTGERLRLFQGFGRYVKGIGFSKDGKLLAAGTDAGGLEIWDASEGKRINSVNLDGLDVSDPVFSPDGKLVAAGVYATGTVWVIDVRSGKISDKVRVSDLGCGSVAFSPDGKYLITPSTGGLISCPYDKGGTIRVFEIHN